MMDRCMSQSWNTDFVNDRYMYTIYTSTSGGCTTSRCSLYNPSNVICVLFQVAVEFRLRRSFVDDTKWQGDNQCDNN
jgi:hypothetical protein